MPVILDVAGLFSGRISIVGSYLDNHPLTGSSFREIIVLSSAPRQWQVPLTFRRPGLLENIKFTLTQVSSYRKSSSTIRTLESEAGMNYTSLQKTAH